MLEALVEWVMPAAYVAAVHRAQPPRAPATRHNFIVPYGGYRVGDGGSVNLAVQNDGQWRRLCAIVLQPPELADDPRFVTNELRLRNRAVLEPLIERCSPSDTRADGRGAPDGGRRAVRHRQRSCRRAGASAARGPRALVRDPTVPCGPLRALHHPLNIGGLHRPRRACPRSASIPREVLAELDEADGAPPTRS